MIMQDFKHLSRHGQEIKPEQSWQDGWNNDQLTDMLTAAAAAALMIMAMFYGLSEAVIRGWIG